MDSNVHPCTDELCRVKILHRMYDAIKDTDLLLEMIQPETDVHHRPMSNARRENAFKTLIATVLSVRSRDETTFRIVENLWKYYQTPKDFMDAPIEKIEELIKSSGTFRNKAKHIKQIGQIIHEQHHDIVPDSKEELLKLPGVGNKVAGCVLVISFAKNAIPVDTHVHRISNRIGWVKTKDPDKTEKELEKLFPESEWRIINFTLVAFGKRICKPTAPQCGICPVRDYCMKVGLSFKNGKVYAEKKAKSPHQK
jgi:endonuclease-3